MSESVCPLLFVPGDKQFLHTGEGGQTFLTHRRERGTNIFHTQDVGGTNIFRLRGGQIFSLGGDKLFLLEAVVALMMLMRRWV